MIKTRATVLDEDRTAVAYIAETPEEICLTFYSQDDEQVYCYEVHGIEALRELLQLLMLVVNEHDQEDA